MDTLTNEDAIRSVSRSVAFENHDSSSAMPIGDSEKLIRDTSDNLGAIREVDYEADYSPLTPDKLQQWLIPPHPLTDHGAAYPGTGKWFIQGKTFRWWKKAQKGASLLIWGECMFLSPTVPSRLLITSYFSQPGRERLSFGMQFPVLSVH
jgi:hypothetical protein